MKKLLLASTALAALSIYATPVSAAPISTYPNASTPLTGNEASIGTQGAGTVQITTGSISTLANSPGVRAALPNGSLPLTGNETIAGTQSGATVQMTTQSIASLAGGSVNITGAPYNADPTGATDSTTAINNAAAAAKANGKSLSIPCGTFTHNGLLIFDSIAVSGSGLCSILKSTDTTATNPNTAIKLIGTGDSLSNLQVTTTWAGSRQSDSAGAAVWVKTATDWSVYNLTITGSASSGIQDDGGVNGLISYNTISNTLADGINNANQASLLRISHNTIVSSGDDCIAVVSYITDGGQVSEVAETGNECINGQTDGFTVIGGQDVSINGGVIYNVTDACIVVDSSSSYVTYGVNNVAISGVVENGCGRNDGNVTIAANLVAGRAGNIVSHVTVDAVVATNIRYTGFEAGNGAGNTSEVTLSNSHLYGAGGNTTGYGVYAFGVSNLDVHDTTIANFADYGFVTDGSAENGGFLKFDDDHIFQTDTGNFSHDAVHIFESGFATVDIRGLTQANGAATVNQLISNDVVNSIIENDHGDNTAIQTPTGLRTITVREGQASSQPGNATCVVGDRVWNTSVTANTTMGWICTTASPGNWTAMPSL